MARNLTPIVKQSRRESVALHPKAIKGLTKHPYKPGQHGPTGGRHKPSQYSIQLREKQKVKRMYGLLEKQFAKMVREAERRTGNSGELLLGLLESRFDNAVYRLGLAPSRQPAKAWRRIYDSPQERRQRVLQTADYRYGRQCPTIALANIRRQEAYW
jgi:small subunit ribosomal protein S4